MTGAFGLDAVAPGLMVGGRLGIGFSVLSGSLRFDFAARPAEASCVNARGTTPPSPPKSTPR